MTNKPPETTLISPVEVLRYSQMQPPPPQKKCKKTPNVIITIVIKIIYKKLKVFVEYEVFFICKKTKKILKLSDYKPYTYRLGIVMEREIFVYSWRVSWARMVMIVAMCCRHSNSLVNKN